MMESIMSSLTAIIIIFPFVLFILVFYIGKQITNKKRSARNIAINVTTIALIFSVHFIIISIWAKSLIWAIILFMILSAIIFTFFKYLHRRLIKHRQSIFFLKIGLKIGLDVDLNNNFLQNI